MYPPNLKSVALRVTKIRGVAKLQTPHFEEGEAVGGSGMVPFKTALVSFYRPSIVTFPLSLRVSEIFPTLPLVSPKFPHVPLGVGGSPLGYKERRCWANCACN